MEAQLHADTYDEPHSLDRCFRPSHKNKDAHKL